MVTAATSSIVIATSPILTALLASLLFRERLGRLQWAAAALEFVGILMLTLGGDSFSLNPGVLWLLLGSLLLSVYNILQRRLTRSYSPLCCSAYAIFFGTLLLSVFAPESFPQLASATALDWVYLLLLGVLSGSVAHLCWAKAMALAEDTSSVSNYMFLTPLFTALLGIAVYDNACSCKVICGNLCIFISYESDVVNFNRACTVEGIKSYSGYCACPLVVGLHVKLIYAEAVCILFYRSNGNFYCLCFVKSRAFVEVKRSHFFCICRK